ncbi:MAG TPA: hypothetical protein VGD43_01655, partial [Micromonospora sp.]
GYPTSGAPGYPTSGAPGYPASGGPSYPTTGAPGYPSSGGGFPTAYPALPTPPPQKRSFVAPLVALASTLVVLVVAILVVMNMRDDTDPDPLADPTRSSAPRPTASAEPSEEPDTGDGCMLGKWEVTSHREEVNNEEFGGKLTFTGGEGATATLNDDGTGRNDYGSDGTEYDSTYQDKKLTLKIRGYVTYSYELDDGQIKLRDVKSYAEAGIFLDGDQLGQWVDFKASNDTANYECNGDRMTQKNVLYTTEFSRVD